MNDSVKLCRRCGRQPDIGKCGKIWYVECKHCHDAVDGFWRRREAIKAWNERHDDGKKYDPVQH